MNTEEESINFLEHHIANTFSKLASEHIIENISWLEDFPRDCARPYATFFESNLIALFPVFCSKEK